MGEWRRKRQVEEEIQEMKHSALLIIQTLPPGTNNPFLFRLHNNKAKENSMVDSDTLSILTAREEKWSNLWMKKENYLCFSGFSISCFERSYDYVQNEPADFISMWTDQLINKYFSHFSSFLRNLTWHNSTLCNFYNKFGKTSVSTPHLNYTSKMNWLSVMIVSYPDNYGKPSVILYVNIKTVHWHWAGWHNVVILHRRHLLWKSNMTWKVGTHTLFFKHYKRNNLSQQHLYLWPSTILTEQHNFKFRKTKIDLSSLANTTGNYMAKRV